MCNLCDDGRRYIAVQQKKEVFFFEKKNQKTFGPWSTSPAS
jgi:hypothetical protein